MNLIPYKDLIQERKFIEFDKLCELMDMTLGEGLRKFSFCQSVPNDSYITLDCSDYGLQDKEEDLEYHKRGAHWNSNKLIPMISADIKLIKILRSYYGIKETVFTYISW